MSETETIGSATVSNGRVDWALPLDYVDYTRQNEQLLAWARVRLVTNHVGDQRLKLSEYLSICGLICMVAVMFRRENCQQLW